MNTTGGFVQPLSTTRFVSPQLCRLISIIDKTRPVDCFCPFDMKGEISQLSSFFFPRYPQFGVTSQSTRSGDLFESL